jgi:aminoglycoside phosphotransferase (APT) family kinase protein
MKKTKSAHTIRHYRDLIRTIVRHYFGKPASRIVYKPTGLSNHVFAVNHVEGQFVVRLSSESSKIATFRKEQWATQKAREAGVPTSEVLEVGNEIVPAPYMISRRVSGEEATHHPNRMKILKEMGRYAAMINSIKTNGFGEFFDWSPKKEAGRKTWEEYLKHEWLLEKKLETLARQNMLDRARLKRLRKIMDQAMKTSVKSTLNHGDMRLKNVIVDEDGEITAIVDWEECLSTVAPEWELSIALHDLSIDEKQQFINGYRLDSEQILEMGPLMKAFNIVNYGPAIESAAEREDTKLLEEYRLRLNGGLDLYCLE